MCGTIGPRPLLGRCPKGRGPSVELLWRVHSALVHSYFRLNLPPSFTLYWPTQSFFLQQSIDYYFVFVVVVVVWLFISGCVHLFQDLSYKEKHWHEWCFVCCICSNSLVDKPFGSKEDKIYCGDCYANEFASRCDGCSQVFKPGLLTFF